MTDGLGNGILVILPTYNERDTLPAAVEGVLDVLPAAHILVIDDASPDGTGEIADALAARHEGVSVLHRAGKLGLGTAYILGFRHALEHGFRHAVEMDSDGSHRVADLPRLIAAASGPETGPETESEPGPGPGAGAGAVAGAGAGSGPESGAGSRPADGPWPGARPAAIGDPSPPCPDEPGLVIGARWVPGGRIVGWPWYRRCISRTGTAVARIALRSKLRDLTSGFRVIDTRWLARLDLDALDSQGYGFQVETAWRLEQLGCPIAEVPITFVERTRGRSKMSCAIVVEALVGVLRWGWQLRFPR